MVNSPIVWFASEVGVRHLLVHLLLKLVLSIGLLASGTYVRADDIVLTLGSKFEWAPYHLDTGDGADGLAVRAAACIFARMNQPFMIQKMPWSRAQLMTKNGGLDGFFAASQNEERDAYATLSDRFLPQSRRLYVLSGKTELPPEGLTLAYAASSFRVAARHQSNALKTAEEMGFQIVLKPQSSEELLSLLLVGRVEAVVENELVFIAELQKAKMKEAAVKSLILGEKNMGVYFGHRFLRKNPAFLERFNAQVPACTLLSERYAISSGYSPVLSTSQPGSQ